MKKANLGQSLAEYFIILTVILVAVLAAAFIGRSKDTFITYFDTASEKIVKINSEPGQEEKDPLPDIGSIQDNLDKAKIAADEAIQEALNKRSVLSTKK
jgi:hypothetical protein